MKKFFQKLNSMLRVMRFALHDSHGLTFIELIVVATIFSILAAVSLFQFSGFNANISLQNVSQDIALILVRAQQDGSSGTYPRLRQNQVLASVIPSPWTPVYGVHFDSTLQSTFYYFFDNMSGGSAGRYDNGGTSDPSCTNGSSECLERIDINSGDKIIGLCIETTNSCVTNTDGTFVSGFTGQLDIMFRRPNLAAIIAAYDSNGVNLISGSVVSAKISIQSKNGEHYKVITVYPVGQITVD